MERGRKQSSDAARSTPDHVMVSVEGETQAHAGNHVLGQRELLRLDGVVKMESSEAAVNSCEHADPGDILALFVSVLNMMRMERKDGSTTDDMMVGAGIVGVTPPVADMARNIRSIS